MLTITKYATKIKSTGITEAIMVNGGVMALSGIRFMVFYGVFQWIHWFYGLFIGFIGLSVSYGLMDVWVFWTIFWVYLGI